MKIYLWNLKTHIVKLFITVLQFGDRFSFRTCILFLLGLIRFRASIRSWIFLFSSLCLARLLFLLGGFTFIIRTVWTRNKFFTLKRTARPSFSVANGLSGASTRLLFLGLRAAKKGEKSELFCHKWNFALASQFGIGHRCKFASLYSDNCQRIEIKWTWRNYFPLSLANEISSLAKINTDRNVRWNHLKKFNPTFHWKIEASEFGS